MREQTNILIPHSSGSISFEGFSLQVLIDATLASLSLGSEFLTSRTSEYTHRAHGLPKLQGCKLSREQHPNGPLVPQRPIHQGLRVQTQVETQLSSTDVRWEQLHASAYVRISGLSQATFTTRPRLPQKLMTASVPWLEGACEGEGALRHQRLFLLSSQSLSTASGSRICIAELGTPNSIPNSPLSNKQGLEQNGKIAVEKRQRGDLSAPAGAGSG